MRRIIFALGLLLTVIGCLSGSDARARQDGANQPKPTPSPSLSLPLAPLRRDFKNLLPIPAGEKLEYEVRYSRFPIYATVGNVTFEFLGATSASNASIEGLNIEFQPAAEDQFLRLRGLAVSKGLLIAIAGVDVKDRFETLVDAKDFSARLSFKEIKEGKKHETQTTLFDHAQQTVKFSAKDLNNAQAPPREKSAARQEGSLDLISAFYFVRLQKLKEGQLIRFPVNDGGANYWFEIVVGGREKLKTDCGKVKTIRLEPKLFGGKFFSKPGEMTMWVSDDNKHVPLKLVAKTPSGTINAKLLNFKNNCKLIDDEGEQNLGGNGLKKADEKANKSARSAVLPQSEAKRLAHLCSRSSPPEFNETWQPSEADIKTMESKLSLIKLLKAECCIKGKQVLNPEEYYLQYIGIVANGRRLIYINAFGNGHPPEDWKQTAVLTCDGGNDWGVLYDPQSAKFFDLSINGIG